MKNIFLLSTLLFLAIFTSCNVEETDDDLAFAYIETEYVSEVNFTIDNKDKTVLEKDALLLTNSSINAVSYHWDFGNGDTSSEAQPDYKYDIHGYYTVTLTITDKYDRTYEVSHEVLVLCLFGGGDHDS